MPRDKENITNQWITKGIQQTSTKGMNYYACSGEDGGIHKEFWKRLKFDHADQ